MRGSGNSELHGMDGSVCVSTSCCLFLGNERRRLTGASAGRESSMTDPDGSTNNDAISVCRLGYRQEDVLKGRVPGVHSRNREDVARLFVRSS